MESPLEIVKKHMKLPFEGDFRGYQKEDINFFSKIPCFGLYYDMGLGKTVTALAIGVYKLAVENLFQIIALVPATLVTQWGSVVGKTGLKYLVYEGAPAQRKKMNTDVDVVIMTYQIFQKDRARFLRQDNFFIIDEATIMCNPDNILYKMLRGGELKKNAAKVDKDKLKAILRSGRFDQIKEEGMGMTRFDRVMHNCALLTGTPIHKPSDAYGLISITAPGTYRNKLEFDRLHVSAKDQYDSPVEFDNLEVLEQNLRINSIHRLKEDHLDLPPLVFNTIPYDLAPAHMELYKKLMAEKIISLEGQVVVAGDNAQRLRHWAQRIVTCPEVAGYIGKVAGLELLDQVIASQVNRFIVVCRYVMTNDKVLDRYDIGGIYGKPSKRQKQGWIEDFKAGKLRGLSLHPESGGYGLDLPEAWYVNCLEMPLTPRSFAQVYSRAHRSGQDHTVFVTVMYARKTIQETIIKNLFKADDITGEVIDTPRSMRNDLMSNVVQVTEGRTVDEMRQELFGGEVCSQR